MFQQVTIHTRPERTKAVVDAIYPMMEVKDVVRKADAVAVSLQRDTDYLEFLKSMRTMAGIIGIDLRP